MNEPLFVVIGVSGEYSDRSEWVVGYINTEAEAQEFVLRAEALERERQLILSSPRLYDDSTRYHYSSAGRLSLANVREQLEASS